MATTLLGSPRLRPTHVRLLLLLLLHINLFFHTRTVMRRDRRNRIALRFRPARISVATRTRLALFIFYSLHRRGPRERTISSIL